MTAEEFIEKEYPIMSDQDDWWWWEDKIYEAMKEYARIKCAEQRELCENKFKLGISFHPPYWHLITSNIDNLLNAPEPKFD